MQFEDYLNLAQILVSLVLIFIILLQARGSGFGGALGGSGGGSFYRTRRGLERTLFNMTIILAVVFILMSAWSVLGT